MKPAITRGSLTAARRLNLPVIERLESRTFLAASAVAVAAPPHAKPTFAISDIFGAGAGFPIWQAGQPVLPASAGPSSASNTTPSVTTPSPTGNGTLLGTATVVGGPAIFSLLPVLPPDDLAAAIVGMLDPSNAGGAGNFNSPDGAVGSRLRNAE